MQFNLKGYCCLTVLEDVLDFVC